MEGWAAAFNTTGGYIGNIQVTWSVNNIGTNASTDPLTGLSSEFYSGHNGGSAIWIADDGSGHQDEVSFTVNAPTLDYILIVDSQGTGVSEIQNQVVPVGFTIQGWAASFNNTIGYLQDVSVSWTVVDAEGADASTTPPIGTSSTFDAGVTSGSATWIANDGFGHTHDVDFTIIPPEIDYIVIMDAPNNSGNEIQDQTVAATFTIEGWAAAFNDTVDYIQDISVSWTVSNSGSTATTNPSSGLSSTFDADINSGTATWRAEDGSGHWDTVIFNVVGLTVDSILIVNSPSTGTDEIPTQNVDVGVYITGWAAAFNDSYGYMQDISVSWSVSNTGSTAETDPPSGTSSTFYSHENGGTARWIADDGEGHTDNVTITINPPSRDYILIVDSSGSGEFEIQDITVGVGFTIQGWAAGFNNTIGYLNDVSTTTWTVSNSGSNATTAPGVGASSTFNAQSDPGTATWTATDGPRSDSVEFTIDPPQIDNILIVDNPNTGEFEIPDQTVDVGFNTTGWAAGFNNTVGYIGDVTVTWSVNNAGTNSTTGPQTDVYSEFRSGWFGGTTIWTAEYAIGKTDTVEFTVNPPTVDYIRIVDSQGTGDQEIPNQTVDIDFRILGFAASFNDTIGYLDDINVNWTVDNINSDASTAPSEGFSSEFFAGWQGGNSTWTADDGGGHTDSITFTINPPQIDYILIVDSPFTGSDEIPDITIGVGQTIEGWAAGFNNIAGYIDDVNVTWSVTNFGTQASTDPLIGNHSYITSGIIGGSAVWRAEDEIGNYDTVTFSISEPQADYIQIHDAPDGTGSVVSDIVYPIGHETRLFGVLMNNTAGYIDDAPANSQWTSQDPNIVTASTPGEYTEIVCSITNFGIIILTIDDGNGHTNTTTITVLEPTTDDLKIMDGPGGSGEEITNPEYPVGAEVDFYGAMFNDTAGYIGDVPSSASWRSSHPRISVDSSGSFATITCSDTDYGTATITLEDDEGNSESVLVTIMEPTVDSVLVRDAPGSSGSPIANHNLDVGSSETYYAIGFNDTAGNLGGVDVEWSNTNSEVGVLTVAFGSQTTFSAFSDKVGSTTILVTYDGNSVGSFVVTIKDTVDPVADAGSDQIAKVGETVFFDASDSSDNVEIEKYTWTFNHKDDQVILTGESEAFEFLVPGNYEISLEVEDSSGNTAYDSFTVVVEGEVGEDEETPWIMIISLIIVILVVLLLLMFLMTKKKKKVQRCRICGKEFYPQTDAEAAQGMCPECATKGIFGAKSSSAIGEPRPAVASTKTVVVRCPSCKEEFDFGVKGDGPQTVTCPHCGTQGQMEF
jgi:DNA-directed RNA polymerase subunit RPC12/RpoP